MLPRLRTAAASTPVSSRTSRRAVARASSPRSTIPFGSATTPGFPCGSMTASQSRPRMRRTTTPPAENSRATARTLPRRRGTALICHTRRVRRLTLTVNAIIFLDALLMFALVPLLPDYVDELGLSKTEAGIIVGVYSAAVLVAAAPVGHLSDRIGPKRLTLAG